VIPLNSYTVPLLAVRARRIYVFRKHLYRIIARRSLTCRVLNQRENTFSRRRSPLRSKRSPERPCRAAVSSCSSLRCSGLCISNFYLRKLRSSTWTLRMISAADLVAIRQYSAASWHFYRVRTFPRSYAARTPIHSRSQTPPSSSRTDPCRTIAFVHCG